MRRFWVWRSCKHLFIEKTITVSIPLISICISGHVSSAKQSSYNSWKYKIVQTLLVICRGMKSIKTVPPPWQSNFGCSKKNRCYCSTQILGYKCKATALRTQHQPLWSKKNTWLMKGHQNTKPYRTSNWISDLVKHRKSSNRLEKNTNYAVLMTKSSVDDVFQVRLL